MLPETNWEWSSPRLLASYKSELGYMRKHDTAVAGSGDQEAIRWTPTLNKQVICYRTI